jgi:hypothetical protein
MWRRRRRWGFLGRVIGAVGRVCVGIGHFGFLCSAGRARWVTRLTLRSVDSARQNLSVLPWAAGPYGLPYFWSVLRRPGACEDIRALGIVGAASRSSGGG